jgi:tetratricopeptide (TPR) repeat protein
VQVDPEEWATLSRLLDEALDVEGDARERWLEELAPAHAGYKDKLRALLRHDAGMETRGFRDVFPELVEAPGDLSFPAVAPGTMVGPYVVEAEIGRGGMGVVWRARRSDGGIKRPVALKLPHSGLHGHDPIERFESERDILAELAHPNIARLYDAGLAANGQPYLALEYVAGMPLTEYCDQHRLDVEQRLHLFQQVLQAVQYAHGRLVIHRDLKPTNVIVGPDGHAMLLDFGIAKLIASESAESQGRLAQVAALTPDYASPEQIMGRPMTIASDVYSLGVLLFELLTGDRPYRLQREGYTLVEALPSVQVRRPSDSIAGEGAARARSSTPQGLARTLRGDLDAIVMHALQKAPDERYPTVDALLHDIDRYLDGAPVAVRGDGGFYRACKLVARNKLSVMIGALAIAALFATVTLAMWQAHAAQAERDRALALSSRNRAVLEFLNVLITEAGGAGKPVTVGDMLAHSETLVNAEFRDRPEHRAAVLDILGSYYHTAGQDSRAEPLLREALDATRNSLDGDLRRQLACTHALSLAGLGKLQEAAVILKRVAEDPESSPEQTASCLEDLAFLAQDEGNAEDALKYARAALDRLYLLPHPSPQQEAVFLGSIGYAEHLRGRNAAAESYYAASLAKFAKVGREAGAEAISVRNNWAIVSDGAGNPKRALTLYDETLRLVAQADATASPPQYLIANRAHALEGIGRFADATREYQHCRSMTPQEGTPAVDAYCSIGLASIAVQLANLAAADEYLDEAYGTLRAAGVKGSPLNAALKATRARVALRRGRFSLARGEIDAAIAESKDGYLTATSMLVRADLNLHESNLAAAEADARAALAFAEQTQGDLHYSSRTGAAWLLLGRTLQKRGHAEQAYEAYVGAVTNLANTVDPSHPLLLTARELAGEHAGVRVAIR